MCGGSSAPSGETKYTWNDDMRDRWNNALNQAEWMSDPWANGIQQYGDQRYAPLTGDQNEAIGYTRDLSRGSSSPLGAMNAARDQITDTLEGRYLGSNPYGSAMAYADPNTYMGDSPQFRNMMRSGMDDIIGGYQRGTGADTTRMFNLSGAFGGSAHQNAVANNELALGKNLSNFADQMLNHQWDRSAQLSEANIARQQSARENAYGRGFNAYENERARQQGAVGMGQNEQPLALSRIQGLLGAGDLQRGANQQNLDFSYQNWIDQQNYPFKMADWLTGIYGRAQGGTSPNQQIYQSGASQAAPWLGAALAGYGLMR